MLRLFFLFMLFLPVTFTNLQAADTSVGVVHKIKGSATAFRRNFIFPLTRTDTVFWKDEIEARGLVRLEIIFKDDTHLWLGDNSHLIIDEMVYEPNAKGHAAFTLSQGVFRIVSGALNKINGSSFTVKTPLATIGVRGTDFWGHQDKNKLTMALLGDGELVIKTANATVTLNEALSAIVIEKGKAIGQPFKLTQEQADQAKSTVE